MENAKQKILIGPSSFAGLDSSPRERLIQAGYEIIPNPYGRKLTQQELLDLLPGVTGIIAGLEPLNRVVLEQSNLKVISRCGSGMSNVDLEAAEALDIRVRSTPMGPTIAVAELTLGVTLSLIRNIPQMNADLHAGQWNKTIGGQLAGKTVAIVGYGRIGKQVAQLFQAFGAIIWAVDPAVDPSENKVPVVSLEHALTHADIISLHCSGDEEILGENEFAAMNPGMLILNAARGGLINEQALIAALDQGVVKGAWVDTFSQEPYSGPLTRYDQVILTPHVGSYTAEGRLSMEMECAENLIEAFTDL
nr:phosphoglycerate dehydrogenase [uncultured Desulfobacter sp.]